MVASRNMCRLRRRYTAPMLMIEESKRVRGAGNDFSESITCVREVGGRDLYHVIGMTSSNRQRKVCNPTNDGLS